MIESTLKIARLQETLGELKNFSNFLGLFQVMTRQTLDETGGLLSQAG